MTARRFTLHRQVDDATIALGDGVQFDDGICLVHLRTGPRPNSVHLNVAEVERMYNRSGRRTIVDWIDEEEP